MLQELRSVRSGGLVSVAGGDNGEQLVADSLARYYSMAKRGNVFFAATPAAVTITVAATTATGFILHNPAGSGKNVVLLDLLIHAGSQPAAVAPLVLTGSAVPASTAVTHTTPLSIYSSLYTGSATGSSIAKADSAATIPTPAVQRVIPGGSAFIGTAAGIAAGPIIHDQLDGIFVLTPGTLCAVQTLTTAMLTSLISCTWAEEAI